MVGFFNVEFVVKWEVFISFKVPLVNNVLVFIKPHNLSIRRSSELCKVGIIIGFLFDDFSFSIIVGHELFSVAFDTNNNKSFVVHGATSNDFFDIFRELILPDVFQEEELMVIFLCNHCEFNIKDLIDLMIYTYERVKWKVV